MRFLILLFLWAIVPCLNAQSEVVREMENKGWVMVDYHFYPSTLRMVNLQRDPAFDDLVRPIRKLDFYSMRTDQMTQADIRDAASRMINEEGYETYMEMDGPDNLAFILGREEKDYTCIMAAMDSAIYVSEVQGQIDLLGLADLYNRISERDTTLVNSNFDFFSMIQNDTKNKINQESRRRKWEEEQKRKEEEEKMRQDSLKAIESEQNEPQ